MTYARTTLLVVLTAGGVAFAGCGGSDDKGLAKAELAKKADAICVKYDAKQKAIPDPKSQADVLPYLNKLLPIAESQRKEIGDLKPADSVKTEWNGLVKDYDTILGKTKDAIAALKAKDEAKFTQISNEIGPLSDASDKKNDAFGMVHCGSQSS